MKQRLITVSSYCHPVPDHVPEMTVAVLSDLHNEPFDALLPFLEGADLILIPGDLVDRYRKTYHNALTFLNVACRIAPVVYAPGNHERAGFLPPNYPKFVKKSGAMWLNQGILHLGGLWIASYNGANDNRRMDELEKKTGVRIVLCHKPNLFYPALQYRDVDLVLSGHAHGGQVRVLGIPLYAPDQGIFPRHTKGCYDGRLYVSAGVGNPVHMPRWGNPFEIMKIHLTHTNKGENKL